MDIKKSTQEKTRWDLIPGSLDDYRLLCSHPTCSLSCANIKNGKLSLTSVHGSERHSYLFTKKDMLFSTICFLENLSDGEIEIFRKIFNTIVENKITNLKKIKKLL